MKKQLLSFLLIAVMSCTVQASWKEYVTQMQDILSTNKLAVCSIAVAALCGYKWNSVSNDLKKTTRELEQKTASYEESKRDILSKNVLQKRAEVYQDEVRNLNMSRDKAIENLNSALENLLPNGSSVYLDKEVWKVKHLDLTNETLKDVSDRMSGQFQNLYKSVSLILGSGNSLIMKPGQPVSVRNQRGQERALDGALKRTDDGFLD